MEEYFCTNCGAVLNDQYGFDPGEPWTCTECGTTLYGDDFPESERFPGVVWYCDGCGAVLNTQYGFDDEEDEWECTECGYTNSLSEDDVFESEASYRTYKRIMGAAKFFGDIYKSRSEDDDISDDEDEEEDEDWYSRDSEDSRYDDDDDDYDNDVDSSDDEDYDYVGSGYSSSYSYTSIGREEPEQAKLPLRVRITLFWHTFLRRLKIALIVATVLAIVGTAFIVIYYKTNAIPVGFSSEWAEGKDYEVVVKELKKQGFTNVRAEGVEDLPFDSLDESFKVTEITFANSSSSSSFDANTTHLPDETVRVYYHSAMQVAVPLSSKTARGMDYHDVKAQFEDAGFRSIEVNARKDLVLGFIDKPDTVAEIAIDGDKSFSLGDKYPVDTTIVIEYHAFKK